MKHYSSAPLSQLLRVLFDSFLFWEMGTEAFHVFLLSRVSVGTDKCHGKSNFLVLYMDMDLVLTHGLHVSMVSIGSSDHRHQHGPLLLHRPLISLQLSVTTQAPGHHHGLRWPDRPLRSIWHQAAAWLTDNHMTSRYSMTVGSPHA